MRYAQIALHFKSAKKLDLLSIKRYQVFQFSVIREVDRFIKRGAFVKFSLVLYRNIWVLVVQSNLRIGQRFWELTVILKAYCAACIFEIALGVRVRPE